MTDFATALALATVIEGVTLALFTRAMQRMMAEAALLPTVALRCAGVLATGLGVMAVWLIRR